MGRKPGRPRLKPCSSCGRTRLRLYGLGLCSCCSKKPDRPRVKSWRAWTRKEIERLSQLLYEGKSMVEIAQILSRSYASVKNRVVQEGFDSCRSYRRRLQWLDAFARPHTLQQVADQMGLTVWAVKRAKQQLRNAGYKVRRAIGVNQYDKATSDQNRATATPGPTHRRC
jgi:hypothetical protein